jgi:hypothetical protein
MIGVEGLCTVLSCVVDFKGDRLIGQTIIPGTYIYIYMYLLYVLHVYVHYMNIDTFHVL